MGDDSNAGASWGYIRDAYPDADSNSNSRTIFNKSSLIAESSPELLELFIFLAVCSFIAIGRVFASLIYYYRYLVTVDMSIEISFELKDQQSTPRSRASLVASPPPLSSSSDRTRTRPSFSSSSSSNSILSLLSLLPDPQFYVHLEPLPIACTINSSTYRGRYNGSVVSIKVWRGTCENSESSREERRRFRKYLERPLSTWLTLHHPSITPLYGLMFAFGKLPAVVTPYYANGDINQYVRCHPGVDVGKLFEMVAAGLTYMHSLNPPVSHGDVRGCNILITSSGTPVLTEIGTSHLPSPPDWTIGSDDGTRWMAPELMNPDPVVPTRNCRDCTDDGMNHSTSYGDDEEKEEDTLRLWITPPSDVYSFGMTMLEVCTGRVPFSHRKFYGGVIYDVVNGIRPPRPNLSLHPRLTDEFWEIIQTCWEQKPKHRPTMGCVKTWLRSLQSGSNSPRRC